MLKTIVLCLTIFTSNFILFGAPQNLIRNGDFSQIRSGKLVGWKTYGNHQTKQSLEQFDNNGNPCAKLSCTFFESAGGGSHVLIGQLGFASKLIKGHLYQLSCRMRASNIKSHSVIVQIRNTKNWGYGGLNKGTTVGRKWKDYRFTFWASDNLKDNSRFSIQFMETGVLYIDDIKLVELPEPEIKFTNVQQKSNSKNLLLNGNFGIKSDYWTTCGQGMACSKLERLHGTVIRGKTPVSNHFLRIPMGGKNTPKLCFDGWGVMVKQELCPLVENMKMILVKKGEKYTFSCYMRSNHKAKTTLKIVEHFLGKHGKRDKTNSKLQTFYLNSTWQRCHISFIAQSEYVTIGAGPDLKIDEELYVDITGLQLEKGSKPTEFNVAGRIQVGIAPTCPGGVFVKGKEIPAININVNNLKNQSANGIITFQLRDYFNKKAIQAPLKIFIPARQSKIFKVNFPEQWRGFFSGTVQWEIDGIKGKQKLRLAIVPEPPKDSILGVNHTFAPNWLISQAKKAGVLWYRSWINWQYIEPTPGQYNFKALDYQINRVVKQGAHMMSILPENPSSNWASEKNPAVKPTGNPYRAKQYLEIQPPKDSATMSKFIEKIVARYADKVKVWEFLNEPVYGTYRGLPYTHYKPYDYYKLFKIASTSMKKIDPGCKVIGGVSGNFWAFDKTSELIKMGMLKYADITNLHLYPRIAPERYIINMNKLVDLMIKSGTCRPIWITEFTYRAYDNSPRTPFIASHTEVENSMLPNERIGADWTLRFFAIMNSYDVRKIFIHVGATTTPNGLQGTCSLFGYGGIPTKTFAALAQYVNFIGVDFKFIAKRSICKDAYAYAFKSKGKVVVILWKTDQDAVVHISMPKNSSAYDAMGNKISSNQIKLDTSLVYLTTNSKNIKQYLNKISKEN